MLVDYHPSNLSQDLKSSNGNEGGEEDVGLALEVTRESVVPSTTVASPLQTVERGFLSGVLSYLPSL